MDLSGHAKALSSLRFASAVQDDFVPTLDFELWAARS
jgi:hypothetical protein